MGAKKKCVIPQVWRKWLHNLNGKLTMKLGYELEDICLRISCGVATGADEDFCERDQNLSKELMDLRIQTISGRELASKMKFYVLTIQCLCLTMKWKSAVAR